MRKILDFLGKSRATGSFTALCTYAVLTLVGGQIASAQTDGMHFDIHLEKSKNPKNCIASAENSEVTCNTIYQQKSSYRVFNKYTGYTHLKDASLSWNTRQANRPKLFNGTVIKVLKRLEGEGGLSAAIALVEVLDGPHKGKRGKVNMALVTRN